MTKLETIKKIAAKNDVRVSVDMKGEDCEGKKLRRIGLHGFLDDIYATEQQCTGYDVTQCPDGHYLTKK